MLLGNVGCTGSESNLISCCATEITNDNSSQCHGRDHAGVRCMLPSLKYIILKLNVD